MRRILPLTAVLSFFFLTAFPQVKNVTGRIVDKQGQSIPFASVRIKGTKTGTSADAEGNYTIKAREGETLIISGTGIANIEFTVGSGSADVTVTRSENVLTEVIVTSLGIKRQAKELGYATAKISNRELTQAKVIDISTGLEGKVSGLQINLTDNGVDPSTRIVLRGNRSITGNNQALLVIDGVPVDDVSYISKINPEDVESVNILKGAVAASLYGSKASNGVMIITTKHGTRAKSTTVVGNSVQWNALSYYPKLQNRFGSYGGEGAYTNPDGTVEAVPYENQSYGPPYNGASTPLGLGVPVFNPDGSVNRLDTMFVPYTYKNPLKQFFKTPGVTNQLDVNFSTGDDRGTFYLGFQDAVVHGIVPKDMSRRDNIRLNGSRNYGRFKAEYSFSYNQKADDIAGLSYNQSSGGVFSGRPIYFEVMNTPGWVPITEFKDWQNNIHATPNGYFNAYATNPYWTIDNSRNKVNTYDVLGNVNLSFKIAEGLVVSDRIGLTQSTLQQKITRAGITFAPWAIADPWNAGNIPSSLQFLAPSEYDETFFEQRLNNDALLSFDKSFNKFSIKAIAGTNYAQRYQRTIDLEGDNLQFPGFYNISSVLGTPGYGESTFKQREYSIYEDVTLGFNDYLFLHLSNRDEWNSVLDPSTRHFEYPGGDLSFIFTQAIPSLTANKVLSFGKVRLGITQVSNINLGTNPYGAYSLINTFVPPGGFPFGNIGGYSQSNTYLNPLIKPEITSAQEVGLDFGLYDNRINFSGAYYHSISKNQNLTAEISPATGFSGKVVNAGQVTNKGLELDLNVTLIKNSQVTWNVGVNYSHYINKLDNLLPGVDQLILSGFTGQTGGIYAVKGKPYPVIETTDWIRDSTNGKVIVDAVTGYPSVNSNLTTYGNTNPTYIMGVTTSVNFKGFTLSAVGDYRGGNQIMNELGSSLDFTGISYHSAENGRQRFIFPNSEYLSNGKYVSNTSVSVQNGGNIGGAGFWPNVYTPGIGSVYITSAAFWKLREISLTYEIPAKALSTVNFIKRAVIGINGRNLLMLRPKSNFWSDPEFSDDNGNAVGRTSEFQTPPTRIYGFNVTLTF
ncbi:MAG TPA: SusC/RagA family TonB-linked outer membrane protein [Puia sp.]|nr:SusC/RagA family TonB-linked outer membrane protein [Puia sp.]